MTTTLNRDAEVTHGFEEVTPTEAAAMLGLSRPQVRELMERGALPFRMVGAHHRIRVADVERFHEAERKRRRAAMSRLTELENELGLFE
jgi:excisionase family DNA binding protein